MLNQSETQINIKDPLVSVCLITYNHEKYIRQAIESILMQKVNFSWEIIIADDYSHDGTMAIVKQYQQKYPNIIKIISREKNVGPGLNFVELIGAANGKYIAYLEGDDYWTDELKLQKQFDFMESNSSFSMCYHKTDRKYTKLTDWALKNPQKGPNYSSNDDDLTVSYIYDILEKGWFIFSSTMFFINLKLPKKFEELSVGDYPLHILLAHIGPIGFLPENMGVYRINHNGLSTTTLHSNDFNKRNKKFIAEVNDLKFLNAETGFYYNKIFASKTFALIYSHVHFTYKNSPKNIIKVVVYMLLNFDVLFLTHQFCIKLFNKFKK